jgi:hypothetical protein
MQSLYLHSVAITHLHAFSGVTRGILPALHYFPKTPLRAEKFSETDNRLKSFSKGTITVNELAAVTHEIITGGDFARIRQRQKQWKP